MPTVPLCQQKWHLTLLKLSTSPHLARRVCILSALGLLTHGDSIEVHKRQASTLRQLQRKHSQRQRIRTTILNEFLQRSNTIILNCFSAGEARITKTCSKRTHTIKKSPTHIQNKYAPGVPYSKPSVPLCHCATVPVSLL